MRHLIYCTGLLLLLLSAPCSAAQIVGLTFWGLSSGPQEGMGDLTRNLAASFGDAYIGQTLAPDNRQAAVAFIRQQMADQKCLVLAGHSQGGATVISLTWDLYNGPTIGGPQSSGVDLAVTIDPALVTTDSFPSDGHMVATSYYQVGTSFVDLFVRRNIGGATNINVEQLFGDSTITHSSIDNDLRLHRLIVQQVSQACGNVPYTPLRIPGDVNADDRVDRMDMAIVAANWGLARDATWRDGDLDGDGAVNFADLAAVQSNYRSSFGSASAIPQASVPEPTAGILALIAIAPWFFRFACRSRAGVEI